MVQTHRRNALLKRYDPVPVVFLCIRLLLAAVFIFSGFVKAIDPLGGSYKINDYLLAFGGFWLNFQAFSLVWAILLAGFELVLGLCLLARVRIRKTAFFALLFMSVMTPLTLYIALTNPVTDCGCFGEALIISNQATFVKNLVLLAMSIALFIYAKRMHPFLLPKVEWGLVGVFVLLSLLLSLLCYAYLPLIDFLPYHKGVDIPEAMRIPEGAPRDEYRTTFIYEKDGLQQEFSLENYPQNDSTWVFVDQKNVLLSKGYVPPIGHLVLSNSSSDDITEELLHHPGRVYWLVMYDLDKTSGKGARRAEKIYRKALAEGSRFYALTASSADEVANFVKEHDLSYPFLYSDPTTLKAMIRSNPGLLILEQGRIVDKKPWRKF